MLRLASILAAMVLAVVPVHAAFGATAVDCDKSKKDNADLQKALDASDPGTQVGVSGTCKDIALVITRSGVGLVGPATLEGTDTAPVIRVQDAGNVSLEDLDVTLGSVGIEVAAARVSATDVDASDNDVDGFSVIQSGALECVNCSASDNGERGLLVIGSAILCGTSTFNDNGSGTVGSGILMFLGGRVFSSVAVCGGSPSITTNGNDQVGLNLFQNASAFFDGVDITSNNNSDGDAQGSGASVFDSSSLTVRGGSITLSGNNREGLIMGSSSVRLTDLAVGTTTITGNGSGGGLGGLAIVEGGNFVGNNMTINNNISDVHPFQVLVVNFGTANGDPLTSTITPDPGGIFCDQGLTQGSLCP